MIFKILICCLISFYAWCVGKKYAETMNNRVKIIDSYVSLFMAFKSAVLFSGIDIFRFFSKYYAEDLKELCVQITNCNENSFESALEKYECRCKEEEKCVESLKNILACAENSNDSEYVGDFISEQIILLEEYKKIIEEDYRGKVKIAPVVTLVIGLFASVLLI